MGRRIARKEERKKKMKWKAKVGLGAVAALAVAYIISCAVVPKNTIVDGVVMNGVNLSGLTQEEAVEKIQEQYTKTYRSKSLDVKVEDTDYVMPMYSTLTMDADQAAKEAFAWGHDNFILRGGQMLLSKVTDKNMKHIPQIKDEAILDKTLKVNGFARVDSTVQPTYELKEDHLEIVMGKDGYYVDMEGLKELVVEAVNSDNYDAVITAPLEAKTADQPDVDAIYEEVHKEKREATLDEKHDYKVIRSVTGIDFDKEYAKKEVAKAEQGSVVNIEVNVEKPNIDTKNLKKHLFEATIGKCTTYVSGSNERISNVKRAASTIDGIILMPGEEFSYNDRVGERTAEAGYKKAPAYNNGESVLELGGGVCQVSSTLYKALVLANLKILEHHNHTYESTYIGLGMDATVSWDGPDLKFKNDMDYPIKIKAEYEDGSLTVKIKGAKLNDNTVELVAEVLSTTGYKTKYEKDPSLEKGKTKVLQSGHDGYKVQTYRVIKNKKGEVISKEKEDYCVYSTKEAIVAKGTKEPATKATTQTKKETTVPGQAEVGQTPAAGN